MCEHGNFFLYMNLAKPSLNKKAITCEIFSSDLNNAHITFEEYYLFYTEIMIPI